MADQKERARLAGKHGKVAHDAILLHELFHEKELYSELVILAIYSRAKLAAHYGREALGE